MKYSVQVFPAAERDLLEIRSYLEGVLKTSADGLIDKFYSALKPLVETPFMHPLVQDDILAQKGFHYLVVENYVAFYKIKDDVVQIHRFIYGRRRVSSLL